MEHKAPYALVGLFVCIMLVSLVGFTIWIEGGNDKAYKHYTVYFVDSVSGLESGAKVSYKGVMVGKIDQLRLSPENENLIKVDIRVAETTPVHASTIGQLATTGVTGLTHLELMPAQKGDKKDPVQVAGEPYPVLEGKPSELSKALKDIPVITKQVKQFSGQLNNRLEKFDNSFIGRMTQ